MIGRRIALTLPLLIVAGAARPAGTHDVIYHGNVMTRDVREIAGRPYIPLADVAKILGGHVASRGGGEYEIATTGGGSGEVRAADGGANQVSGSNTKVGQMYFDGRWRFIVNQASRASEYVFKYATFERTVKPSAPNDELIVLNCTIKNGHQSAEEPILTVNGLGSQKTALTDEQGQSYPPIEFDVRGGNLAPGAAKNFTVVFSVPKGTKLHDMIFTLYGFANTKENNVRVDLSSL